ncbi:MAG: nuclear transport factor 2 family protein [Xanthomonadales bacterium]|nr:nuclear transport factor 2 family protein [Xanthomonadales bacterium]
MSWLWLSLLPLLLSSEADADVREQARCAEIAFSNSAERRDLAAFKSFLDPDARFVAGQISRGPDEVAAGWAPFFAEGGPSIRWRPAVVEVTRDGRMALIRGPYRVTTGSPDNPEVWGHFISTWRLNGERWQVLFDSGGDNGMTPTEEERALLEMPDGCPP